MEAEFERHKVEKPFSSGEIVRVAKKLGLQTPFNEELVEISQEMAENHEPPRKYTPARLSEILDLNNSAC